MKRFILFFIAALFLSACGSDSTTKFTAASGTITAATATANITSLTTGAGISFTGSPNGKPASRTDVFATCVTKTPATPTDADSDGIKTQTRTYACTNVAGVRDTTYTSSQNGTATETDKDDSDAKSGWKYEYDVTGSYTGTGRSSESWEYKGFWELTKAATSFTYAADYKGTSTNTRSGSYVGGGTWSHTVTPTDMTNPYTAGGALSYSGFYAYTFTVDSVQTQYVFKMTSTNLTYAASPCTNFFNGGSYTYTDSASNTITVTHTSCSARTATFKTASGTETAITI